MDKLLVDSFHKIQIVKAIMYRGFPQLFTVTIKRSPSCYHIFSRSVTGEPEVGNEEKHHKPLKINLHKLKNLEIGTWKGE